MKTIQLRTEIPGPKSRALMARREAAIPRGPANATPVFAARAEGAVLEDVDGNRYLDFAGGIGCLNAGHRSPRVLAAIREQLERFLHLCFAVTPYEGYVAVAEKLNVLAPGNFPKKSILVNSGAEAIENSIKIARAYTKRPAVICFEDAFHGRTLLTMSLTSKTQVTSTASPLLTPIAAEKALPAKPLPIISKTLSNAPSRPNPSPRSSPSRFSAKVGSSFPRSIT